LRRASVSPGHRQIDARFVDEKKARRSTDDASAKEAFAFLLDLGPIGLGGVEGLF
jgi:hypothetical protein